MRDITKDNGKEKKRGKDSTDNHFALNLYVEFVKSLQLLV